MKVSGSFVTHLGSAMHPLNHVSSKITFVEGLSVGSSYISLLMNSLFSSGISREKDISMSLRFFIDSVITMRVSGPGMRRRRHEGRSSLKMGIGQGANDSIGDSTMRAGSPLI